MSEMAPIATVAMDVLVAFKKELHQDQLEEDEMEALRDIDATFAEWEREILRTRGRSASPRDR